MSVKVYNTMTRSKEEFTPRSPGHVRIYVCGVTVYDLSHVGHARSAMVFDVIQRYLRFKGYRVTFVRNFTDVDDRIIRRANAEGVPAAELSERYIQAFREDMAAIGVAPADVEPKATEHIPEMIALIERLVAKGFAYTVNGDVYFEIRRFRAYGRLSGKNLDELLAGARVEVDERKRDPRDFALWKSAKPGEPAWPSPWGPGRPGWHVECSAMATKYLGESFDVHGGGEDLIFPHHECEIAQSEADTGRPLARYWLHNGMVNFGAEKMSKSLGNVLTIREFVKRHAPDAFRLFVLGTHYRHPVDFAEERVRDSARALERLTRLVHDAHALSRDPSASAAVPEDLQDFRARFEAAMDDDFNTPQALGVLFDLARVLSEARDRTSADERAREHFAGGVSELVTLGQVLGLLQRAAEVGGTPADVLRLVEDRGQARARRDWRRADQLRDEIHRLGWSVEDTPSGPRVARKGA
ncbi:MAG: cysteine--tRNA ligase [Candidatus Rokuibacteriota bacterium]|nr:MAG: cysteine--tRNA ligase [Candidatus Rokubacteria bacterium]